MDRGGACAPRRNCPICGCTTCAHTYASFALRRGETLVTIGRLLGHCDPETTLKYAHFSDAMPREAVEIVAKALGG